MLKRYEKARRSPRTAVVVVRNLAAVAAACLVLRAVSDKTEKLIPAKAPELSREAAELVLGLELPGGTSGTGNYALAALALELPGADKICFDAGQEGEGIPDADYNGEPSQEPPDTAVQAEPSGDEEDPEDGGDGEEYTGGDAVGTTITGEGGGYELSTEGIYIKNKTDYEIDVEGLLTQPLEFSAADGAQVLIIHTHGSEAYMPDGDDVYEPSDPSRTEDKDYNVVRVGDELERVLTERGITVIHDRELYDYPSYAGSYSRAYEAICAYLEEYPDIKVVIDLHRDALEADDGTIYKTVADIGDTPCAQVMLIAGTNFSGLSHDNWQKNLSFALKIQAQMVAEYPTLARPLSISQYRYNQNATSGSLIAEIGSNGNTLQEALCAVRYFGECLADVLGAGEG
ncbi:MAG: stage II sporulation protein P [Oscillospiraceae bacterium]